MAPDAVHHLGRIPAPEQTQKVVILARADKESADGAQTARGVDWSNDPADLRAL